MNPSPLSFDNTEIAFANKTSAELKKSAWLFSLMNNPVLVSIGTSLTPLAFKWKLPVKSIIKNTIYSQFCGGETLAECTPVIEKLAKYNVQTILDYGVEGKETEEDFDNNLKEMLNAISFANNNGHIPFASIKVTGYAHFALLEKLNSKTALSVSEKTEWANAKARMHKACKAALDAGISLMIDAEETWIQDPIDDLADELMLSYNTKRAVVINTFQFYRTDMLAFLKSSYEKAKAGKYILGAKLVRGAYMEKERVRALELNYPSPIQPDKAACDKDYNSAVEFCLQNIQGINCCIGSHNEYSNKYGAELAEKLNVPHNHPHLHFSQLLGMSDNLTFNLAAAGYNASKYVPYGPVSDVVPYLMRRAKENTSIAGQTSRELTLIRTEVKRREK
jgi:proline dehydrogenase